MAEHEREMIAKRTKDGLAAAKAKGVVLGNADLAAANKASAIERARELAPIFAKCQGRSARRIAAELNVQRIKTPTGAPCLPRLRSGDRRFSRLLRTPSNGPPGF